MRLTIAVPCLVGLLATSAAGRAQQVQSFAELPLRINRDDKVRVVDQSGAKIRGRVVSFGREGLTIQIDGGARVFGDAAVRRVDRSGSSKKRGALIGAGLMAAAGLALCGNGNFGAACPIVTGAVFGAPLGTLVGAWVPSMHTVYRAPATPAAARAATASGSRTSLMEELGMAVNLGDRLSVESATDGKITGTLNWLGDDGFGIASSGDSFQRDFTRETVRRVSVTRSRRKLGALLGFAAVSALCLPSSGSEWLDAFILCGGPGAGVGAIIGSNIHSATIVYPAQAPRLSVTPALLHHRFGIRANYRF